MKKRVYIMTNIETIEARIIKTETFLKSLHGNTSSVKMKKYAMANKIGQLRDQLAQALRGV